MCLDTCHLFAAGYDVSTAEGLDKTFKDFDRVIGRQYLKGMHVNDSKAKLSSKRYGLPCLPFRPQIAELM